nr:NADH dehydrogenase subunit 2 [Scirtothrips hansoni]
MKNSFNHQTLVFLSSLTISIFLGLSSNSFLMIWMAMEINLFSFIPLMSMKTEQTSEKSMIIYFLIQSISSMIIFVSVIFFSILCNQLLSVLNMMIFLGLFMKMGMFPFHFWVISMIENISWTNCFILLTIQKILPLTLMFCMIQKKSILILCFLNSLIASLSGLTMFSLRKIFSFSSMNHLSLMIICMMLSKKIFKIYFFIYSMMNFLGMKIMNQNKTFFLQEIMLFKKNSLMDFLSIIVIFFSMAGIPPFIGFMPKMFIIMKMVENSILALTFFILIFNTIASFFYLRLTYMNLVLSMTNKKYQKKSKTSLPLFLMIIFFPMD